jgi:hypothetical protein
MMSKKVIFNDNTVIFENSFFLFSYYFLINLNLHINSL